MVSNYKDLFSTAIQNFYTGKTIHYMKKMTVMSRKLTLIAGKHIRSIRKTIFMGTKKIDRVQENLR